MGNPSLTDTFTDDRLDEFQDALEDHLVSSPNVRDMLVLTQSAYDATSPKIATTVYVIVG